MVEILYQATMQAVVANSQRMAGIDFGVDNLVTIINNIGLKLIVVNGKVFKAVNQYFNEELARLLHQYAAQGIKTGTALLWWRATFFAA